jgi:hypothetical protein
MRRRHAAVLAMLAFALVAPAGATAGILPGTCPTAGLGQPFLPFLDPMSYVLAPDGGFEQSGDGWKLRGGAGVERGNESYFVRDARDRRSLSLPAGASAVSPPMCVGIERPTLRFFSKGAGGVLPSTVLVEVLYNGLDGELRTVALLPVASGGSWQPTLPLPILANLLPNASGDRAVVAFRFTALTGATRIDDVYVDPYAKR